MVRESFEDPNIAGILNRYFVCIKVDRKEHPDVDARYMRATLVLTGHGGWPNSVWLTPDGRPWFAATYVPWEDQPGRPGFNTLLLRLAEAWISRRGEILAAAEELWRASGQWLSAPTISTSPPSDLRSSARDILLRSFDPDHGGFGGPPKFPPHGELAWCVSDWTRDGDERLKSVLDRTLSAMARGAIHDVVGGGFHCYATDVRWFLPHYEMMLSDYAQLLRAYVDGWRITGRPEYVDVARNLVGWLFREMRAPNGTFCAAMNADDPLGEGMFYQWSWDELTQWLTPEEVHALARACGARPEGNAYDEATGEPTGRNLLAPCLGSGEPIWTTQRSALDKLLRARVSRPAPARDPMVLLGWNGLTVGALSYAGDVLGVAE